MCHWVTVSLSDSVDSRVCGTVRLTRAAQLLLSSPCVAVGDLPTFSIQCPQRGPDGPRDSGLRYTRTPPIRVTVANLFSVQFSSILVPYMGASIFHVMCVCKGLWRCVQKERLHPTHNTVTGSRRPRSRVKETHGCSAEHMEMRGSSSTTP